MDWRARLTSALAQWSEAVDDVAAPSWTAAAAAPHAEAPLAAPTSAIDKRIDRMLRASAAVASGEAASAPATDHTSCRPWSLDDFRARVRCVRSWGLRAVDAGSGGGDSGGQGLAS